MYILYREILSQCKILMPSAIFKYIKYMNYINILYGKFIANIYTKVKQKIDISVA